MIMTEDGEEYVTVVDFAKATGKTTQAIRYLCAPGNTIRALKHIIDNGKTYIAKAELWSYPFVKGGRSPAFKNIYHYSLNEKGEWEAYLCEICTRGRSYNHNENMLNMQALESSELGQVEVG